MSPPETAFNLKELPLTTQVVRLAHRWIRASGADDLDLMFRLAILEGAGLERSRWGKWWTAGKAGLAKAQAHFAEVNVDPKWFQRTNTGFYREILSAAKGTLASAKIEGIAEMAPDAILTNALYGLGPEGERTQIPLFHGVGKKYAEGIESGAETPWTLGKVAKHRATNRARSAIRNYRRKQNRYRQDYSGEGEIGDRGLADKGFWEKTKLVWFARVWWDPTDPLGKKIQAWVRSEFSKSRGSKYLLYWLDASMEAIRHGASEPLSQKEVADHFGVKTTGLSNYFGKGPSSSRSKAIEKFWKTPLADKLHERFVEEGGVDRRASRAAKLASRWLIKMAHRGS